MSGSKKTKKKKPAPTKTVSKENIMTQGSLQWSSLTDQPFGSWTDCLIVGLSLELSSYLIKSNPVAQVKVKQKKKKKWKIGMSEKS